MIIKDDFGKDFEIRNLIDNFFIYPKEFKGFRLISMDTHCKTSNMGEFTNERLEIFSQILLEKQSMPTAIFMHHPPFDVSETKTKNIEYTSEKHVRPPQAPSSPQHQEEARRSNSRQRNPMQGKALQNDGKEETHNWGYAGIV